MADGSTPGVHLVVDGQPVTLGAADGSLLDALRDELGMHSVKDGCSPQGQCGCCTVLVDGQARVACVTPVRRVAGRSITTADGIDDAQRQRWAAAFCATGASQCGFCTPGIVCRLEGLRQRGHGSGDHAAVEQGMLAHLCRCTGWRTILDAWDLAVGDGAIDDRDLVAAAERATIEGGWPQTVAPDIALGAGGFADDTAPPDALVAVPDGAGGWVVGASVAEARAAAGKVQGRRTTVDPRPPLEVPDGRWTASMRTSWVEPAYLELDASWCEPGGSPVSPLANGGAFGGKVSSEVTMAARQLADEHGRPVRVLFSREDATRYGPKRPPVAGGALADGSGVLRVVRTPGIEAVIASVAPLLRVELVDAPGPPTSLALRAAGWAEAAVLLAGARGSLQPIREPGQGVAEAEIAGDGTIRVRVNGGDVLDPVVVRSYVTGAAHMALSWVCAEGLAVGDEGEVLDLTIRSFNVLRAVDMPPVEVEIDEAGGPPVRVSDAAFVAVAAATWLDQGCPTDWPTDHRYR